MSKDARIAVLAEKLARVVDAKRMATTPVWAEAWEGFELELLERLLKCGPDDDSSRYRLQISIECARHVRRLIESAGAGEEAMRRELDILEGRKVAPIA